VYKGNTMLPKDKQKVICLPDISETYLSPDDFLLICCDGIFEAFTNETAIQFIHQKFKETRDSAAILSELLTATLKGGSRDNMTAMIVECTSGEDYHQNEEEFIPGKYYPNGNESFFLQYRFDCECHGLKWDDIEKTLPRPEFCPEDPDMRQLSSRSQPLLLADKTPINLVIKGSRNGTQSSRNLMAKIPVGLIQKIDEEPSEKQDKPMEKPAEKPTEKPAEKPTEKPTEKTEKQDKPEKELGGEKMVRVEITEPEKMEKLEKSGRGKKLGRTQSGKGSTKENKSKGIGFASKIKTSTTLKRKKK